MNTVEQAAPPPEIAYLQILTQYWQAFTVRAVAELRVADHLKDGPADVKTLAQKTGTHAPTLYRILRALGNSGFFVEGPDQVFSLTPVGELLISDAPKSLHSMVMSELGMERIPAWHALPETIRTGRVAFDYVEGKDIWQHYREHPQQGEYFMRWMTQATQVTNQAILEAMDFSPYRTIVDVAGGQGAFLEAILAKHPACEGILFDQPEVIERAAKRERMRLEAGSFFERIPQGGDLYMMKWIIHDWEKSKAEAILNNVYKAMEPHAKLLLIEGVVEEGPGPDFNKWMDINMLAIPGGQERTAQEYSELLATTGFRLDEVTKTNSSQSLLLAART